MLGGMTERANGTVPNTEHRTAAAERPRSVRPVDRIADRTIALVGDYLAEHKLHAEQPPAAEHRGDWLRLVPPSAALGTAFVLQTIAITDTVGTAAARQYPDVDRLAWYITAAVLGLTFAAGLEGGAALLMRLYDRHLVERDSTGLLRLGMVIYVAASAGLIHWWLHQRHLPALIAWALAFASASALFLYTRESRWRNRVQMRAAGQIDPALPRLSLSAKAFHPIRWVITMYLISWQPVATTDEARARYDEWRSAPRWWSRKPKGAAPEQAPVIAAAEQCTPNVALKPSTVPAIEPAASEQPTTGPPPLPAVRSISAARPKRKRGAKPARSNTPTDRDAARMQLLKERFDDWRTNTPTVRECADALGFRSSSTALPYQQKLVAEANGTEQEDAGCAAPA